ncbi:4464_t:CDS:2, partial [Racocetra fulgida]
MTESIDEKPIKESSDVKLDSTEEQILKDQINIESSDIKLNLIEEQILKDQINVESSDIKLDPKEEQILKDQINVTKGKLSYISLYRFATKFDWIIIITRQIREQYFRAILRQNIAYFDEHGSGEVTTRITSDTHSIQDGISLESQSRAGIIAEEAISTIRTVVAFGAQKKLSNLYDTYLSDARKEGFKKSWVIGISL